MKSQRLRILWFQMQGRYLGKRESRDVWEKRAKGGVKKRRFRKKRTKSRVFVLQEPLKSSKRWGEWERAEGKLFLPTKGTS